MTEPFSTVRLYHPSGAPCTLFIGLNSELEDVERYLRNGFLVNPPGVQPNEDKQPVAFVIRKEKIQDGDVTPVIGFYSDHPSVDFKVLSVYLNEQKDVDEFLKATGLKRLTDLPVYEGQDWPKKGSTPKIVPLPATITVVTKQNPMWKQDEKDAADKAGKVYKKAKRVLVRYEGVSSSPDAADRTDVDRDTEELINEWNLFLLDDPSAEKLNSRLPELSKMNNFQKKEVWGMIQDHCSRAGLEFDKTTRKFVAPVDNSGIVPF